MIDADGMIGGMFDVNIVTGCFPLALPLSAGEILSRYAELNVLPSILFILKIWREKSS